MRWYRFDPFAIRPREKCTVGALRAEAKGHDVSEKSMNKRNLERTNSRSASSPPTPPPDRRGSHTSM